MKKIKLQKLYSWQKDCLDYIRNSYKSGKYIFIKSLRQRSGKTFLLMNALLCCAYDNPGCKSLIIEPVNNQNDRVFNDLLRACSQLIKGANKSTKEIIFDNDSIIYLRSAEAGDSIRGTTVTGICCVDEACYISDEYINTLLPVISVHKAPIIFASSPSLSEGFFYNNYSLGLLGDDNIVSFNWTDYISEMYTEDELAFYKQIYSKRKYTTEILGEFIQNDGSLFTNIEDCINETTNKEDLYFGIDWGSGGGKDYTAVACLNSKCEMVFIKYFNDKAPTEQIDYIADLITSYKPVKVTVESNSIGNIYFDMLQKKVAKKILKFTTTNDSKNRIIDRLGVAFENKEISIIRDNELLLELKVYAVERTKTGKVTYNAPTGYKDDLVMATAICFDSIFGNKGKYTLS